MKVIFFSLVFLISINCFAQSDSALKYSEIIQLDGLSKETLYQRARIWANDVFKNSKNVIKVEDKETGELAGKASLEAIITYNALGKRTLPAIVTFKFQIFAKDGKYKYIFSDIIETSFYGYVLSSANENPYTTKGVSKKNLDMMWSSLKSSTEIKILSLVSSLKATMQKKSEAEF